jgi:hypothetical protein
MPADPIGDLAFQYPGHRGAKVDRAAPIIGKPPKEPQEKLGVIQGKSPRSREEWRVAVALWRFEVRFDYQVWIRGGTRLRGGQILDFLTYIPYPQPLQVFGDYWHRVQLRSEDRFKLAVLRQIYHVEPLVLWGRWLQTQQQTNEAVREVLGL